MTLTETILSDQRLVALLTITLLAAVLLARRVRLREIRRLERVRGAVWRTLDPVARRLGRPLTRRKTRTEYVCTVQEYDAAMGALWRAGWRYNPVSTKKYRRRDGTPEWTVATVVYRPRLFGRWQFHAYVFPASDGTRGASEGWDVYAHAEINLLASPRGHVSGPREAGDVGGHLRRALDEAGVSWRVQR